MTELLLSTSSSSCMPYMSLQSYGAFFGLKQVVLVQRDFSVANHFSNRHERSLWEQDRSFPDDIIKERCLCTRALGHLGSSSWPLVFDPYRQFELYLRALNKSQKVDSEREGAHLLGYKQWLEN